MQDLLFLGLAAVLFAVSAAYVHGTRALIGRTDAAAPTAAEEGDR